MRRLLNILTLVSVTLCVAAATMWMRSLSARDAFPESLHGSGYSIRSWDGRIFMVHFTTASSPGLYVSVKTPSIAGGNPHNPDSKPAAVGSPSSGLKQRYSNALVLPRITLPAGSIHDGFGFSRATVSMSGLPSGPFTVSILAIPYCAICVLSLLIPIGWWIRVRLCRRIDPNRCRRCSYNLTGNTSGRCPECGAEIKWPAGGSPVPNLAAPPSRKSVVTAI